MLRGLRGWNAAVAASAAIVVLLAIALGVGWLLTLHGRTTTYSVSTAVTRVELRVASGQAVIVGTSGQAVRVIRSDRFAFGHAARERRSIAGGVLRISSACPRIVLGSCSASYELAVPETVAVSVQTTRGDVQVTGFRGAAAVQTRSGSIDVEAYCGFTLEATSGAGNVHISAACAPRRLDLRTGSGDAIALVPPGRYRVSATAGSGRERVAGLVSDPRAPLSIDAHSGSGSVAVEGGP